MKSVAITGIGVIAPSGIGKEQFWNNTKSGKTFFKKLNFKDIPGNYSRPEELPDLKSRVYAQVEGFQPDEMISQKDRYIQFALEGARLAIEDANINLDLTNGDERGVVFATAIGGTPYMDSVFYDLTEKGKERLKFKLEEDKLYASSMFNTAAEEIATKFNCYNVCTTISTGCTAGIDAIGYGYDTIRCGEAKVIIAGSAEAPLAPMTFAAFDVINALTNNNAEFETASRPFDAKRDGFVLSEGCAFLVLEELEHALVRKAHIYGEILGYASGNNAFHMTDLPEDGIALGQVIKTSFKQSQLCDTKIGYINAHGSSTPQNDVFETAAYKYALGEDAYHVPISSSKSMIGHPLSAASSIGIISSLLAMEHSFLPPTANLKTPDPLCDLDYIPNEGRECEIESVLITASGFSGIHSAMYIKKPDKKDGE